MYNKAPRSNKKRTTILLDLAAYELCRKNDINISGLCNDIILRKVIESSEYLKQLQKEPKHNECDSCGKKYSFKDLFCVFDDHAQLALGQIICNECLETEAPGQENNTGLPGKTIKDFYIFTQGCVIRTLSDSLKRIAARKMENDLL